MVRNWFLPKREEMDPTCFSVDDTIGDILANPDVQGMAKSMLGGLVSNKLLIAATKKIKLSTVLNLKVLGLNDEIKGMVGDFLQTVKKQ